MLLDIERLFIRVRAILEQDLHSQQANNLKKLLKIKVFHEKNVEK